MAGQERRFLLKGFEVEGRNAELCVSSMDHLKMYLLSGTWFFAYGID